jgi:hypothetical protein
MEMIRDGVTSLLPSAARQVRALAPVLLAVYVATAAVLLAVGLQGRVPAAFLVRDASQVAKFPFYIGLVSHLGMLLWSAAASISLFSAAVARDRGLARFLLAGGLLTAWLGLDDLFTLHESAFPDYLGISEKTVLGAEILFAAAVLLGFVRVIVRTDFLILGLALAFFASSEIFDQGFLNQGLNYLLDDGLKLFGLVSWTTYFVRTSAQAVHRPRPAPRSMPERAGAVGDGEVHGGAGGAPWRAASAASTERNR